MPLRASVISSCVSCTYLSLDSSHCFSQHELRRVKCRRPQILVAMLLRGSDAVVKVWANQRTPAQLARPWRYHETWHHQGPEAWCYQGAPASLAFPRLVMQEASPIWVSVRISYLKNFIIDRRTSRSPFHRLIFSIGWPPVLVTYRWGFFCLSTHCFHPLWLREGGHSLLTLTLGSGRRF